MDELTPEACPFCNEPLDETTNTVTVNQVIRLYEFFERDAAGLLILPASSVHEQKFYDNIFA